MDTRVWLAIEQGLARVRPHRQGLSLAIDAVVIAVAWNLTYLFRLGFERWISARADYDPWVMAGVIGLYLLALVLMRVPQALWRFAGFAEVRRLAWACAGAGLVAAVVVLMAGWSKIPRSVLALHPLVTLMGLIAVRIAYRMFYEHLRERLSLGGQAPRRALVLGAGQAARLLLAGIQHQGYVVLGLLDDDPAKQGARLGGVPVLGPLASLNEHATRLGATHLIVAMPSLRLPQRRRVIELASGSGLPVLTVPTMQELIEGSQVGRVREIEPEDLLGREPVQLDEAGIAEALSGATVLVTGAGGSIGSELCRRIARYGPARLVLLEQSEYALYAIEQELGQRFPHIPLVRLLGDVRDAAQLRRSFLAWRPQIVFHAAAYKHVPLTEEHNAWAALRNNTLGTLHAARAAAEAGAARFVLISTDKAVNPTNVMGATKRAAEMVLSQLAAQGHATRFMAVRFGNVLGSSGSVVPKFQAQIAQGGPVTVTHPEITRYFMTIPEAARLVIQAAVIGETGQVFVLDMGEPVRIAQLARDLIRLSGHSLDEIPIVYTGLRPGEKLYEELLADADTTLPTRFARLRIARLGRRDDEAWVAELARSVEWLAEGDDREVRAWLHRHVPEYRPADEPALAADPGACQARTAGLPPGGG
jgi:FlaA1/EpsC-like NDP-sugar epimerase